MTALEMIAVNVGLPTALLVGNVVLRWSSDTARSAGSDWILLLFGLDVTTLTAIAVTQSTASYANADVAIWMGSLCVLGFILWPLCYFGLERAIVNEREATRKLGVVQEPGQIVGTRKTVLSHIALVVIPVTYASLNVIGFLGAPK